MGRSRPAGGVAVGRTELNRKDAVKRSESGVPAPLGRAHWRQPHSALTAALNLTNDAVYFVSLEDMRICSANVAATLRTGYHATELVGMPLANVVAVSEGFDTIEEFCETTELTSLAARATERGKDGQTIDVHIRWRRVADEGESLLVAVVREMVATDAIAPPAIEIDPCDPLTRLPSRARLAARLRALERQMRCDVTPVALLFLDVDRFKEINDTLGHLAGDQVLCEIAQRLLRCVRQDDLVVRYGGDEFVVLLDTVRSRQQVEQMVERIAAEISLPIPLLDGEVNVTASIGLALACETAEIAEMLQLADQAMYRAKRATRRPAK